MCYHKTPGSYNESSPSSDFDHITDGVRLWKCFFDRRVYLLGIWRARANGSL